MSWVRNNKLVAADVQQEDIESGDYTDTEITIKAAKLGDTLLEFEIDIDEAYNGSAPVASIGIDTDHEKYMTEAQSDLTSVGTYVIENTVVLTADEVIKLYIDPNSSTTGKINATLRFLDTE